MQFENNSFGLNFPTGLLEHVLIKTTQRPETKLLPHKGERKGRENNGGVLQGC